MFICLSIYAYINYISLYVHVHVCVCVCVCARVCVCMSVCFGVKERAKACVAEQLTRLPSLPQHLHLLAQQPLGSPCVSSCSLRASLAVCMCT
jgi:hypothetical protein